MKRPNNNYDKDKDTSFQLGLEQICSISSKTIPEPKQLICSICLCININPKQCKNKRCNKIFCGKCYSQLIAKSPNSHQSPLCPFCRIGLDYRNVDDTLQSVISSLKFYCMNKLQCTGQYTYDEMNSMHNHSNSDMVIKCSNVNCKEDNNWMTVLQCGLCQKYYCFLNEINKGNGKGNNKKKECIRKCSNCLIPICYTCIKANNANDKIICGLCECKCSLCSKSDAEKRCSSCNSALCSNCIETCDTCKQSVCINSKCTVTTNALSSCDKCSNIKPSHLYISCLHQVRSNCKQCNTQCMSCFRRISDYQCAVCSMKMCAQTCTFKCKGCSSYTCDQCSLKCLICKKTVCKQCSKWCDKCGINNSIVICNKCSMTDDNSHSNSNIIKKCDHSECNKNICLNCWNVCNYCSMLNCSSHSYNCVNCEESMCNAHYSKCSKCGNGNNNDSNSKVKCCLKNCTYKCAFCPNETNALCKKDNHLQSLVTSFNCEHYTCLSCVKYCGKCTAIVISCPKCIVNYYFSHCKYCDGYLCQSCSKDTCSKCDEAICCLAHKCTFCQKTIDTGRCLNCLFKYRTKCFYCDKEIKQNCVKCNKTVICSLFCYYNYKESLYRSKNDKSEVNILLDKDNDKHNCNGNRNRNEDKGLPHELNEMFICNEHFKGNETLMELYTQMVIYNKQYIIEQINQMEADGNNGTSNTNTNGDMISNKKKKCPKCIII